MSYGTIISATDGNVSVNPEKYAHTPVECFQDEKFGCDISRTFKKYDKILPVDAIKFYTYNGKCCDDSIRIEDGYVYGSLAAALHSPEYGETVKQYFGKIADKNDRAIAANFSLDCRGVFVATMPYCKTDKKLMIINFTESEQPVINLMHNLFVFGEESCACIVEYCVSSGQSPAISNNVTETVVGRNAKINIVRLNEYGANSKLIFSDFHKQCACSVLNHVNIVAGGDTVRTNTEVCLAEKRCDCNLYGLSIASGKQHIDNYTFIDHAVSDSSSNELYKSMADDSATGIFNGRILVRSEAQKTAAYQSSKNILLNRNAKIYAKPQLEIYADDVKCSHGATIGQLNDDELFYMQARGIGKQTARQLLLSGFANEIAGKISDVELREFLVSKINERLAVNINT
ncbi:MAG: Fe-S cluster assembly protein SufD [Prevotellaceae bacterium]|jgi:Fe-S cluster assembly protein SufD|nr:Fe-S cluster assembly protein SufD [Prevotellaceae bacterium]